MPHRDRHRSLRRHHVPASKDPRAPGHHVGPDFHDAIGHGEPVDPGEERQVHILSQRQHTRVGLDRLELARRLGLATRIQLHLLDGEVTAALALDGREPLEHHALFHRLLHLEIVRGHLLPRPSVDDDRLFRAQPFGRTRHVQRRVPAAVHQNPPTQQRLLPHLYALQHLQRIQDPPGVPRRYVRPLRQVRTHRQKRRVELPLAHLGPKITHLPVEPDIHAHLRDPLHLRIEHVPRQPVLRDPKPHHPARHRSRFIDRDRVPHPRKVVRAAQPRRTRTDHKHPLAARRGLHRHLPSAPDREIAEEPFDRVDADRTIDVRTVAAPLAGVVARPPHHTRERVVLHDLPPCCLVVPLFREVQPPLDVLPSGTGVVARRQPVHIHRTLRPPRSRLVREARANVQRDRKWLVHTATPSATSPNRLMFRSAIAWICASRSRPRSSLKRCANRPCSRRYSSTGTRRRI